MGPQASKSYPGQQVVKPTGPRAERAKQEIDYGRRDVAGYVFGALQPVTGTAFTQTYQGRTTANWVDSARSSGVHVATSSRETL